MILRDSKKKKNPTKLSEDTRLNSQVSFPLDQDLLDLSLPTVVRISLQGLTHA